jgi:hypothetical protein
MVVLEGLGDEPKPAQIVMDAKAKAVIGAYISDGHLTAHNASPSAVCGTH